MSLTLVELEQLEQLHRNAHGPTPRTQEQINKRMTARRLYYVALQGSATDLFAAARALARAQKVPVTSLQIAEVSQLGEHISVHDLARLPEVMSVQEMAELLMLAEHALKLRSPPPPTVFRGAPFDEEPRP